MKIGVLSISSYESDIYILYVYLYLSFLNASEQKTKEVAWNLKIEKALKLAALLLENRK